ncbi:hypothetical protein QO000_002669 [Alkalihalobacillus hemicentroti]|uniref:Uncharacterized protein n=1 Tax=Guptibacillus hwajinpoensis TaxID=208199 RepID=A0ABU0K6E6_9BACL|nr:hypothetical protein [Alkalihalobacillus hemicentroti]
MGRDQMLSMALYLDIATRVDKFPLQDVAFRGAGGEPPRR